MIKSDQLGISEDNCSASPQEYARPTPAARCSLKSNIEPRAQGPNGSPPRGFETNSQVKVGGIFELNQILLLINQLEKHKVFVVNFKKNVACYLTGFFIILPSSTFK